MAGNVGFDSAQPTVFLGRYRINSVDLLIAVANLTNADANYRNEYTDPATGMLDLENQSIVLISEMVNPGNASIDLVAEAFDLENVLANIVMAMAN